MLNVCVSLKSENVSILRFLANLRLVLTKMVNLTSKKFQFNLLYSDECIEYIGILFLKTQTTFRAFVSYSFGLVWFEEEPILFWFVFLSKAKKFVFWDNRLLYSFESVIYHQK